MTAGTFSRDLRVSTSFTFANVKTGAIATSGTSMIGGVAAKSWSGVDSPPPPKWSPTNGGYTYHSKLVYDKKLKALVPKVYRVRSYPPLKRSKIRPPHDYNMTVNIEENPPCAITLSQQALYPTRTDNYAYTVGTGSVRAYIGGNAPGPVAPTWSTNDQIELLANLRSQVAGSSFNMSVFLGESHKTLQMIGDTAIKLARAYSLARKGDIVAAARTLGASRKFPDRKVRKQAASNWLELQYGWLPLLSDMRNGARQLSHALHLPFSQTLRVRKRKALTAEAIKAFYLNKDWSASPDCFVSKQIVAILSEPVSPATLSGLLDPETVLWELTPFSFVADWVAPIGDYLEARAFLSHVSGTFVETTMTHFKVSNVKGKTSISPGSNLVRALNIPDAGFLVKQVTMTRTVSSSLSIPQPTIKPLSEVGSFIHCANALALMTKAFKS